MVINNNIGLRFVHDVLHSVMEITFNFAFSWAITIQGECSAWRRRPLPPARPFPTLLAL